MSGDEVLCSFCENPVSLDNAVCDDEGFYHQDCWEEMNEELDSQGNDLY